MGSTVLFFGIRLFETCEANCALHTENKRAAAVSTWRRKILEAKDCNVGIARRGNTERTNYYKKTVTPLFQVPLVAVGSRW